MALHMFKSRFLSTLATGCGLACFAHALDRRYKNQTYPMRLKVVEEAMNCETANASCKDMLLLRESLKIAKISDVNDACIDIAAHGIGALHNIINSPYSLRSLYQIIKSNTSSNGENQNRLICGKVLNVKCDGEEKATRRFPFMEEKKLFIEYEYFTPVYSDTLENEWKKFSASRRFNIASNEVSNCESIPETICVAESITESWQKVSPGQVILLSLDPQSPSTPIPKGIVVPRKDTAKTHFHLIILDNDFTKDDIKSINQEFMLGGLLLLVGATKLALRRLLKLSVN